MKKKTLLSSILVMALCLSIIAGSTFALFTDEKELNIAVTSANVEVEARLEVASLWSALATTGDAEDKYLVDEYGHNYVHEDRTSAGTFTNGGTADLDTTGQLVVEKITPGDKVVANIYVKNNGNVSMIYRYVIVADETSTKLADGMIFSTDVGTTSEAAFTAKRYVSAWSDPVAAGAPEIKHVISLELPVYAGDEYQSEDEAQPHGKSDSEQKVTYTITVEAVQGNAGMVDETNAGVPVTTTVNTATGKTEVKENTVLSSNGYSATIPAGTTLENGATTTTLTVTDEAANVGNFTFGAASGAETKGLNISIPEVADDNTTPITVTLKGALATGLTNVMLFHKGVPMTAVASAAKVDADGEFYYNSSNGNITLATTSFSNFTTVVPNYTEVATEKELITAVNAGENVMLTSNITLTKTLLIKKNVLIDLNGKTIDANIASGSLLQSSSDTDPDVLILSSKSGAAINAGDKSVLLGYGSTSIYNVEINVGDVRSSSYNPFKVYGDLTLGKGTVVNVEYLGTSLISNNAAAAIVIDGAKINVGEFKVNGGAMISINQATTVELNNTEVTVGLNTTYTSYFVSQENKATINGCTFNVDGTNGESYTGVSYTVDATGKRWVVVD